MRFKVRSKCWILKTFAPTHGQVDTNVAMTENTREKNIYTTVDFFFIHTIISFENIFWKLSVNKRFSTNEFRVQRMYLCIHNTPLVYIFTHNYIYIYTCTYNNIFGVKARMSITDINDESTKFTIQCYTMCLYTTFLWWLLLRSVLIVV